MNCALTCYGRHSGTEPGWMMFEFWGDEWEEPSKDWEEVLELTSGRIFYRNKFDGREALAI